MLFLLNSITTLEYFPALRRHVESIVRALYHVPYRCRAAGRALKPPMHQVDTNMLIIGFAIGVWIVLILLEGWIVNSNSSR